MKLVKNTVKVNETMFDAILNDIKGVKTKYPFMAIISDTLNTDDISTLLPDEVISKNGYVLMRGCEAIESVEKDIHSVINTFTEGSHDVYEVLDIFIHTKSSIDFSMFSKNKYIVIHQYFEC